ncbi:MAG: SelB C-terminal domain-containing protein, partial [Anaerolineales bacterium]
HVVRLLLQDAAEFLAGEVHLGRRIDVNVDPDPVVAARGDRYILRRPSPSETLGGGVVVDPFPLYRYKRFDNDILDRLQALQGGDPRDILLQTLTREKFGVWMDIIQAAGLDPESAEENLKELIEDGVILEIGKDGPRGKLIGLRSTWEDTLAGLLERVSRYHASYPLRPGMALEELKNQSGLKENLFRQAVAYQVAQQALIQEGPVIRSADFKIQYSAAQEKGIKNLLDMFVENPTQPPSVAECTAAVGNEVFNALTVQGDLIQLSSEVVFSRDAYHQMVQKLREKLQKEGTITVAQARDMFGSSRKYMLAFLEHLDQEGITVRDGDLRRLSN